MPTSLFLSLLCPSLHPQEWVSGQECGSSGKHMVFYTDVEIQDQLVYTLSLVRKEPV